MPSIVSGGTSTSRAAISSAEGSPLLFGAAGASLFDATSGAVGETVERAAFSAESGSTDGGASTVEARSGTEVDAIGSERGHTSHAPRAANASNATILGALMERNPPAIS